MQDKAMSEAWNHHFIKTELRIQQAFNKSITNRIVCVYF